MKRFFIISLLVAAAVMPSLACIWIETDNHYLFNLYDGTEFRSRTNEITENNWKAYLGLQEDTYYYFDADEVIEAARSKNDALMVSYVENLQKYLSQAREVSDETWNYPTKEELQERAQALGDVRNYALSKIKTRLRSQHALLYMRCNMLMGNHKENIDFWEQTAKDFIETVYKDMMENIYAGALLKCGRDYESGQIFARQGDWQSLMTQFYEKRSFEAIRQEYRRDANSATLTFLLQDFVNNVQEAADNDGFGKLFVRDIQAEEALQMINFCADVLTEGKTSQPLLWQTAKAWMEYLTGNRQQALTDIQQAVTLDGEERLKNVARIINLYISTSLATLNVTLENHIAAELTWLESIMARNDYNDYYSNAYNRIVRQAVIPKFADQEHKHTLLQLQQFAGQGEYDLFLETASVDEVLAHVKYRQRPAKTQLDKYIKEHAGTIDMNDDAFKDLIGTKYLRNCQWEDAIRWLRDVPASYYEDQSYACYAYYRRWTVEPWVKRQWLTEEQHYSEDRPRMTKNPKLAFAEEMQKLEGEAHILSGQALFQRQYDLAIRYAQAHGTGDCWFLLHGSKIEDDTAGPNEQDYSQRAIDLLRKAGRTTNRKLKERVLFARAYVYLNPDCWRTETWDSNLRTYVSYPNEDTQQYRAFAALADFENANPDGPATYVSRCDEYIQFRKHY